MKLKTRITIDPNASPEAVAAYVATLSPRERVKLLKATSGPLGVSRATAEQARVTRREFAKGV